MQWRKWQKIAKELAIWIGYQKWPLGDWRFWRNWRWLIMMAKNIPAPWRLAILMKIARGLAISRMWQIFKLDAKNGRFKLDNKEVPITVRQHYSKKVQISYLIRGLNNCEATFIKYSQLSLNGHVYKTDSWYWCWPFLSRFTRWIDR